MISREADVTESGERVDHLREEWQVAGIRRYRRAARIDGLELYAQQLRLCTLHVDGEETIVLGEDLQVCRHWLTRTPSHGVCIRQAATRRRDDDLRSVVDRRLLHIRDGVTQTDATRAGIERDRDGIGHDREDERWRQGGIRGRA